MSFKPKLVEGLLYAEKLGKHLFLNPQAPNWIVVNTNGGLLLSQCDGKRTVQQIAAACGAPRSDAELLFGKAAESTIIFGFPAPDRESSENYSVEGTAIDPAFRSGSLKPRTVHWKLTGACNLRCRYCYAESGVGSSHLSLAELGRVAQEVSELSSPVECTLSGGEPLLHPNALEFGELLRSMGNTVSLLTNGTLISAENAGRIAAFCRLVKVSVDGSTEEIHAITRGRTNHHAVVAAVDLLVKRGANVQVAMTVHKKNIQDVDAMTRRYGRLLTFQPLFRAGRGAERDDLVLTGKEYYEVLSATDNVEPMAAIAATLERLRGRGIKHCALANAGISISESGDVYPCQLLALPEFMAGNVRKTPFQEIYLTALMHLSPASDGGFC